MEKRGTSEGENTISSKKLSNSAEVSRRNGARWIFEGDMGKGCGTIECPASYQPSVNEEFDLGGISDVRGSKEKRRGGGRQKKRWPTNLAVTASQILPLKKKDYRKALRAGRDKT